MNIVYTKFTSERAPKHQTSTTIYKKDDVLYCKKAALNKQAYKHIANIRNNTDPLLEIISYDEKNIIFEYVNGKTIHNLLSEAANNQDISRFYKVLEIYKNYVYSKDIVRHEIFNPSLEFIDKFGYPHTQLMNCDCFTKGNIDLSFGNIIEKEAGLWITIDSEWVFDFEIPVKYSIWRSLMVHCARYSNILPDLSMQEIFDYFELSEKECEIFSFFEHHFSELVFGKNATHILTQYMQNSFDIDMESVSNLMLEKASVAEKKLDFATLYLDTGNGFIENSVIHLPFSGDNFCHKINLPTNVLRLRFDPTENEICIVKHIDVLSDKGSITCTNLNGHNIGKYHMFFSTDPQFLIQATFPISWIIIEAKIYKTKEVFVPGIMLQLQRISAQSEALCLQMEALGQEKIKQASINRLLKDELSTFREHYHAAINQRDRLDSLSQECLHELRTIQSSTFWRITKPARSAVSGVKRFLHWFPLTRLPYITLSSLRHTGVKATILRVQLYMNREKQHRVVHAATSSLTAEERNSQEKHKFNENVKISVIVPLYNTPKDYLCEMIESILVQTYSNWELCLADGSDGKHKEVVRICNSYVRKDKRIKYKKLTENLGISENSNKCIEMSTGDYIGLLDHDDLLHPSALFEVMSAIEYKNADFIYTDEAIIDGDISNIKSVHFKPDFAIDYFRSVNYICHFTCFRKSMLDLSGGFRPECDGSQDYDLFLRLIENAERITHIPKILYYWRAHSQSVASVAADQVKPYAINAAKLAISDHLKRCGLEGEVEDSISPSTYRIRYKLKGNPLMSIVIPNKDEVDTLRTCIDSIEELTAYENYEIIIVENNSTSHDIFSYYEELRSNNKIKVVKWEGNFNFSAICNYGANYTNGDYILFLNNDIEVISPDWLTEMLMFVQRNDVGAVGAKLYYPDDSVQHAGVILGLGGVAGHSHKHYHRSHGGYLSRLSVAQNFSAVTGACLVVPKKLFAELGGFDEAYRVALNDVDFCMRIRQKGYLIVFTPYAELYHYESKSRGFEDTPEKIKRFQGEITLFRNRWAKELAVGDPYYNPNLTLDREDFSIRT